MRGRSALKLVRPAFLERIYVQIGEASSCNNKRDIWSSERQKESNPVIDWVVSRVVERCTTDGSAKIGLGGRKHQESIGLMIVFNDSASKTDVLVE